MPAKLYGLPASHPVAVVERALQLKGIAFERTNYIPVAHKPLMKVRFGGSTVPGLVLEDGRKIQTSRAILRALDEVAPEPRLYPGDPRVEAADTWGDSVLQPLVRRLMWAALSKDTAAQGSYSEGVKLTPPVPPAMARLSGGAVAFAERRIHGVNPASVKADLADLPRHLDRIDGWIADGTLGGEQPNAADLQIAASLRLLVTLDDVAPLISGRPCGEWWRRVFPQPEQGRVPAGALRGSRFAARTRTGTTVVRLRAWPSTASTTKRARKDVRRRSARRTAAVSLSVTVVRPPAAMLNRPRANRDDTFCPGTVPRSAISPVQRPTVALAHATRARSVPSVRSHGCPVSTVTPENGLRSFTIGSPGTIGPEGSDGTDSTRPRLSA
jgi:glutathione S-transferase